MKDEVIWILTRAILLMAYAALAAVLVVSCAYAAGFPRGTAANGLGGKIVLTSNPGSCADPGRVAYSTDREGAIKFVGCWYSSRTWVVVLWADDDRLYEFTREQFGLPDEV